MNSNRLFLVAILAACHIGVVVADESFPQKMEGRWGAKQNVAEIELVQMESPTKAKLSVILWDGCTRRGETVAELKGGTWEFIAPGGAKCDDVVVKMTQIEGKNRFEGTTATARGNGTIYFEWK